MQIQFCLIYIYINTLTNFLGPSNCDLLGYADDNTISACIDPNVQNNEQKVIGNIQNSLEKTPQTLDVPKQVENE